MIKCEKKIFLNPKEHIKSYQPMSGPWSLSEIELMRHLPALQMRMQLVGLGHQAFHISILWPSFSKKKEKIAQ